MADFVAVIRKAVDNLSENTPENRTKVYDKARAAIRRQLEAVNPPPSDEVIARQLDKLDRAIDEVEIEHAEALPADVDETDALMAELESMVGKSPAIAGPAPVPVSDPRPGPRTGPVDAPPVLAAASTAVPVRAPDGSTRPAELSGTAHDRAFGLESTSVSSKRKSGGGKGGLVALLVILVLGLAAFAGWAYKDTFVAMLGTSVETTPIETPVTPDAVQPATETAALEPAPAEPAALQPEAQQTPAEESGKFTQRLNPDGSEIDAGPAPGPAANDPIEGRSVAELTDAAPADEAAAEDATADAPVAPEDAVAPASEPLGVTQKMILYEERLGQQSLEVKPGTVVWTLVNEPSDNGPDEQVIRGEINNPDKGLSALITFKRNTDPSLPASHLVEVVFALPTDFDGGSIDQLQRISLKQTEVDQGNPLIAVPAKITQDFYMVALNDLAEARKFNNDLLRHRNWIDIPVVYANGRQALITLEKGASGTEVFNQALDAWAKAEPQP